MSRQRNDILQGTLALLVLRTLLVHGRLHGYAITTHIQTASQDLLRVEEGSLYPALHRLELDGMIESEWGVSENNRRAKFYKLTTGGRARFRAEAPLWHRHADAIAVVLRRTSPELA
jgi:transcriptional regulator